MDKEKHLALSKTTRVSGFNFRQIQQKVSRLTESPIHSLPRVLPLGQNSRSVNVIIHLNLLPSFITASSNGA